jgi:hypothetical protein
MITDEPNQIPSEKRVPNSPDKSKNHPFYDEEDEADFGDDEEPATPTSSARTPLSRPRAT